MNLTAVKQKGWLEKLAPSQRQLDKGPANVIPKATLCWQKYNANTVDDFL